MTGFSHHEAFTPTPPEEREQFNLIEVVPQGAEFWREELAYYLVRLEEFESIARRYPRAVMTPHINQINSKIEYCRQRLTEAEEEELLAVV